MIEGHRIGPNIYQVPEKPLPKELPIFGNEKSIREMMIVYNLLKGSPLGVELRTIKDALGLAPKRSLEQIFMKIEIQLGEVIGEDGYGGCFLMKERESHLKAIREEFESRLRNIRN